MIFQDKEHQIEHPTLETGIANIDICSHVMLICLYSITPLHSLHLQPTAQEERAGGDEIEGYACGIDDCYEPEGSSIA